MLRTTNTISALAAAAFLATGIAGTATAADRIPGYYLGIAGGGAIRGDSDVDGTGINTTVDFETGWVVRGNVGYAYTSGWRGELELSYSASDVDSIAGAATANGDSDAYALMVNALYDFEMGWPVTPYIGAGLGAARVAADGASPIGGSVINDKDVQPAIQGIAGFYVPINEKLSLTADYRYIASLDPNLSTATGTEVDANFNEHRIMVGLRWSFAEPPAPPAPKPQPVAAPAPAPAPPPTPQVPATYLVFFDFDRSDLRADSSEVVRTAAANAKIGKITRLMATGHADRSGTNRYNLALSERRANAVRAELVRLGIPAEQIAITFKGEAEPLVPTDDGVREPQNRRVEIVFQ